MTTEQWVHRLNEIARKLDDSCDGVHPSAWPEITRKTLDAWKKLAKEQVNDEQCK